MRTLVRSLIATAALAALVLGTGASTALAASSPGPAQTVRYDFDADWCFDDVVALYCTTMNATLLVTATPDGRELASIHVVQDVVITAPNGASLGGYRTVSLDRTVFASGGQDKTFTVEHTRASGPWGRCVSTAVYKVVDYEIQMDKLNGPLCA